MSEDRPHLVQLPEHLLEPQLVCLVDDDEQHLVVHRRPVAGALKPLDAQQRVKLQIVAVVEGAVRHLPKTTNPGFEARHSNRSNPGFEG